MAKLVKLTLVLLALVFSVAAYDQPKVVLKDGSVILGETIDYAIEYLKAETKIDKYLGIPYAKPPVGLRRFRPSEPKEPLKEPLNATKVGNACIQFPLPVDFEAMKINAEFSEDCLYLDVYVPNPTPKDSAVLVSIHGGGFVVGSGSMGNMSFSQNVLIGNYIVVSINYRLNAFGFLTTGDDVIPGNLALRDQQLSLQWVADNIAAFGGDPNNVSIIGVSAGSASVGFHLLSPGSKSLFRRAIMESGSPIDSWCMPVSPELNLKVAQTIARLVGCTEEETAEKESLLACLQRVPAEDILTNETQVMTELQLPNMVVYPPSVDGTFLPKHPNELLKEGSVNPAEVIVGTNQDEGTMFMSQMFPDFSKTPYVNSTVYNQLISLYTKQKITDVVSDMITVVYTKDESDLTDPDQNLFQPLSSFLTDYVMMCSQNKFTRLLTSAGLDVYRFCYTHISSVNLFNSTWSGAGHGDEAFYSFGAPFDGELINSMTDNEREMSLQVMKYWTNLIRTGNPNQGFVEGEEERYPSWPKFTNEREEYKELSLEMNNNQYLHAKECYFLDAVFPELQRITDELEKLKEINEDENAKWTEEGHCEGSDCHTP